MNITPEEIARGLLWADTIDTDPEARHRLANLLIEHGPELLRMAQRVVSEPSLDDEIMRFVHDFYPETNHERRIEHFLSEVKELQDEPLPEGRIEEAADCALILFHMMLADGGVPLEAMRRKLRIARDRIETGVKQPRPFLQKMASEPPAIAPEVLDELERVMRLPARDNTYFGLLLVNHAPELIAAARCASKSRPCLACQNEAAIYRGESLPVPHTCRKESTAEDMASQARLDKKTPTESEWKEIAAESDLDAARARVAELEGLLAERDGEITRLNSHLDNYANGTQVLKQRVAQLESQLDDATKDAHAYRTAMNYWWSQYWEAKGMPRPKCSDIGQEMALKEVLDMKARVAELEWLLADCGDGGGFGDWPAAVKRIMNEGIKLSEARRLAQRKNQ